MVGMNSPQNPVCSQKPRAIAPFSSVNSAYPSGIHGVVKKFFEKSPASTISFSGAIAFSAAGSVYEIVPSASSEICDSEFALAKPTPNQNEFSRPSLLPPVNA
jgi:hypothetical protein